MANLKDRHMVPATAVTADAPLPGEAPHGVTGLYLNLANNSAGGQSDVDVTLASRFQVSKVVAIKSGANSAHANDEVRMMKGATQMTETIELGINVGLLPARTLLFPANTGFNVGDVLRARRNIAGAGTNNAVRLFIYGFNR